jgi:hypothetical protein
LILFKIKICGCHTSVRVANKEIAHGFAGHGFAQFDRFAETEARQDLFLSKTFGRGCLLGDHATRDFCHSGRAPRRKILVANGQIEEGFIAQ